MKYRLQQCLNSFNGPSTEKRMNIDANKKKFIGLICIFDPGHPRYRHYIDKAVFIERNFYLFIYD